MAWKTQQPLSIGIDGAALECRCWGPPPGAAPTIVLLHEGLGSVAGWKDFPERLSARTGFGVFAYSRAGYGNSDPVSLPRPLDYMTREGIDTLPLVLDRMGFERGILLGHSDGASIATIYAGGVADYRVRGLVLLAPHFFTEPEGLAAIARARAAFDTGDLRARLAKYHRDPEIAFRGWNDAWLDPGFRSWNIEDSLAYLRIPVLAVQGGDDQYGTPAQLDALERGSSAPVEVAVLDNCKHAPQIDQPEATLSLVAAFTARLERIEAANPSMQ